MIRDSLNKLCKRWDTDYFVSYKRKDATWTKWYLLSQWSFEFEPNYRQVLASELVIESDLTKEENKEIAQTINKSMQEKEVGYYCSFTGNKSYHNHSFWKGLEKLDDKQRTRAKELLAEWLCEEVFDKIDLANLKPKRLILIHGAKHPKTGKEKTLFDSYKPEQINEVPEEIIEKAKEVEEKVFDNNVSFVPTKCPFVDYALKNKLPTGTDRNGNLVPNVVAITDSKAWEQCALAQDKTLLEFENWAKRKPKFNCEQLRRYAKAIGKQSICTKCLLEEVL